RPASSRSSASCIRPTSGASWWSSRSERGSAAIGLPAPILLDELVALRGVETAIGLVVLPQALLLLRRKRLELLVPALDHALPLLGQRLVALVVLPRALLLLGRQLLPRAWRSRLRAGGRAGQAEDGDERQDGLHPLDRSSSPPGPGASSMVVVWMASKC